MIGALRVARIAGVEIFLDWSLLIIFILVTVSLGGGLFPQWHPEWNAATTWLTAAAAAVLLLVSVLLHELSHAIVGRAQGAQIKRITLFVFGGMAHIEEEPKVWRAEFWMAIVGPFVSLGLGIAFIFLGSLGVAGDAFAAEDPEALLRELSPLQTLLLWLGPVNIVLAIFNIIPAFPLDGGRVLRAILWGTTGDLTRATRWASQGGQAFAWVLIAAGISMVLGLQVPVLGTGAASGLWIALIGWFLHNAAVMSYRQQRVQESLQGLSVARLMQTDVATVPSDLSVQALVDDYLMARKQRCYPVVAGERVAGVVCLDDVRKVPRASWTGTRVESIMTPADALVTMAPNDAATEALAKLSNRQINQVLILEHGRLRGILSREDLLRPLAIAAAR